MSGITGVNARYAYLVPSTTNVQNMKAQQEDRQNHERSTKRLSGLIKDQYSQDEPKNFDEEYNKSKRIDIYV